MATSSGMSSSSSSAAYMDEKKRSRMISNRESARRSRLRKQKQLDDLTAEMDDLLRKNQQIAVHISSMSGSYLTVAAENSILTVQKDELGQRLRSMNEIIELLNVNSGGFVTRADVFVNSPGLVSLNSIPTYTGLCRNV